MPIAEPRAAERAELWRTEFALRATFAARVLLIEASSRSGCQPGMAAASARFASSPSRVVWECSPKRVVNSI